MKKSLLIVLLVIFAFTLWTVVAFGKANKTEKPTQVQKTEQNVEPQFPKVAPPPEAEPFPEVLTRGTVEDFVKAVKAKTGKLPSELQQMQAQPVEVPEANATEAMPVYCIVGNQQAPCCFYKPGYEPYLSCWSRVRYCTYLNIDDNPITPACAFPYYPFDVDTITTQLYAGDVCSLYVLGVTYSSRDIGGGCMFLNAVISRSDSFWVQHPGGFLTIKIPMATANACVYGPFFGLVGIKNTDDFYFPGSDPFCSGAPFQFGLSWIYDLSGRECQSYWNSRLIGTGGSFYDVVPNGIVGGAIRIRAIGHTATDNLCTNPANEWYYKDSLALAPGGVPDFDQGQMPPAFCGPVSGADILWWQFAKEGLTMPASPVALINEVAAASGTVPGVGTMCDALGAGILAVAKAHGGWWFTVETRYRYGPLPSDTLDFKYIQKELRRCQTLTLLLGFWQFDGANWYRFGGHFVALSGVDIFAPTYQFAFSDPAIDNAEVGGPGVVKHAPVDPWPHLGDFVMHNNPADASRDWYPVSWPSSSPGGYLYLPNYVPTLALDTVGWVPVCNPIPPKNHFKTWRTLPQTFDTTVSVLDQFMQDNLRLVGIEFLSNPVLKVHGTDTYPILDETHHLTWYRAVGRDTTIQVKYLNQIEPDTAAVTIDSVMYLLVPAQKQPHDPPQGLDHYKAYRIKDPVTLNANVVLEDQFDRMFGMPELITTLEPRYFLTPAIKNLEPRYDPLTHYVAYAISPERSFELSIGTIDQFGMHVLQVQNSKLLLVPTSKCDSIPITKPKWSLFNGQNAGPFPNTGTYNPAICSVKVEIEQAIDLSAGLKRISGTVNGSHIDELNNNQGGLDGMDVLFGSTWVSPLYKGTLFSGTSQADLRGDYGDYFPSYTFTPLGPPVWDSFSVSGSAGPYNIEVLTNNFAHADLPGLDYNMYAFGVWVPTGGTQDCEYMIEDVYVLDNTGVLITGLEKALFFDYDIGGNAAKVDWDQQHASLWMWDDPAPDTVFGLTEIPAVKGVAPITGWGISNPGRIYDGQYVDSMKYYMEHDSATGITGWGTDPFGAGDDMSLLLADAAFDLGTTPHINKYIKWGYIGPIATGGDAAWRHFLYNVLHQLGYYRADVNKDGKFDVADIIYLVNYCFKGGPKPIEFVDQGDVNNDGNANVTDVISMVNNRFKGGPFPIDKERFYEGAPTTIIPAAHKGLTIRESLFNDPAWKTLGQ